MSAKIVKLGTKLTELQATSLDCVARDVLGALGIVALPNIEAIDSANLLPSGTVICVRSDAQLDIGLLPDKMFSVLALFPIIAKKGTIADEYFKSRMSVELGQRIAQKFGEGPTIANADLTAIGKRLGSDEKSWKPMLGGGFWSISKYEEELYTGQYYIAVYVPKTKLSTEFRDIATKIADDDAHSSNHSTFKDILELPEYHIATQLAQRNASKIALEVANAFGVVIHHTVDTAAPVAPSTLTQPMIALPRHVTQFNHFDRVKVSTKTKNITRWIDSVAIYNGCGSINESVGGFAVPVSPRLGIDLYPNLKRVPNFVQNNAVNAIPQGRSIAGKRELRQPDLLFNQHHVFWSNKRGMAVHPKMKVNYNVESDEEIQRFLPNGADEVKLRLSHVIEYLGEKQPRS
jgi:hypothetical protein